jgi:hypothetical protein
MDLVGPVLPMGLLLWCRKLGSAERRLPCFPPPRNRRPSARGVLGLLLTSNEALTTPAATSLRAGTISVGGRSPGAPGKAEGAMVRSLIVAALLLATGVTPHVGSATRE